LSEQNELVMNLNERLNKEKAKLDQLKDLPEYEEEIKRKKQLTKNLEKDLKEAIKERKEREKQVKNLANQDGKNALLEASITEEIKRRDAMEERLNIIKPLDDLKEQESELQRQNAEDQAIIQDENASPSDKEAAEGRDSDCAKRKGAASLGKDQRDLQKIRCDRHCRSFCRWRHNRGCRRFDHRGFESHRPSFGERPERHWRETRFSAARADWIDCEFSVQSCGPSHRVSGRAHLAAYSCRCGLFV